MDDFKIKEGQEIRIENFILRFENDNDIPVLIVKTTALMVEFKLYANTFIYKATEAYLYHNHEGKDVAESLNILSKLLYAMFMVAVNPNPKMIQGMWDTMTDQVMEVPELSEDIDIKEAKEAYYFRKENKDEK